MSSIACNAESGAQGVFSKVLGRENKDFNEEINQALALKLDLKTTQQANEKSLSTLISAKGSAIGLRQTLQARAAIYGNVLSPS